MALEAELTLHLAGTAARRAAALPRIRRLLDDADPAALERELAGQRLLALAGTRLEALAPERLTGGFRAAVAEDVRRNRGRSLLLEAAARVAHAALAGAGVRAVDLKGPSLARALHGDAGLRRSSDVDLLVAREQLDAAVEVLRPLGWQAPRDPRVVDGLPQLHCSLEPTAAGLAPVEVHWRLHWYERGSTATFLAASAPDGTGTPQLRPDHLLAALLLFHARDGFVGLRYVADVAALWDRHAAALGPDPLGPLLAAHPALAPALLAAARCAERLGGIPPGRLSDRRPPARARLAVRLANWSRAGTPAQRVCDLTLTDALLSPASSARAFARRHVTPPRAAIAPLYGLDSPDGLAARVRRLRHARGSATTFARGWAHRLAHPPERPPAAAALLLAVHSTRRGGAERMAVATAVHLAARHPLVIAAPPGPLLDELAAAGELLAPTPLLPVWGGSPARWAISLARTAADVPRLAREIRARDVRLVLANTTTTLAPVLAARLCRVPVVVHARDVPGSRLAPWLFAAHGRLADVVVTISDGSHALFAGRSRAHLARIPDGVAPGAPSEAAPPGGGPARLALVGAIDPRKGQDVAVEALGRLAADGVDARLLLAGRELDAGFAAAVRARARALGVERQVAFLGELDGTRALLRDADVVIAPSRDEWTPLAVIEALAEGRPVVAAAVGDVPSVLDDGRTGLLVAPEDPAALAGAVSRLLGDRDAAGELGRAGRRHVERSYSLDGSLARLADEIDRLTRPAATRA